MILSSKRTKVSLSKLRFRYLINDQIFLIIHIFPPVFSKKLFFSSPIEFLSKHKDTIESLYLKDRMHKKELRTAYCSLMMEERWKKN